MCASASECVGSDHSASATQRGSGGYPGDPRACRPVAGSTWASSRIGRCTAAKSATPHLHTKEPRLRRRTRVEEAAPLPVVGQGTPRSERARVKPLESGSTCRCVQPAHAVCVARREALLQPPPHTHPTWAPAQARLGRRCAAGSWGACPGTQSPRAARARCLARRRLTAATRRLGRRIRRPGGRGPAGAGSDLPRRARRTPARQGECTLGGWGDLKTTTTKTKLRKPPAHFIASSLSLTEDLLSSPTPEL